MAGVHAHGDNGRLNGTVGIGSQHSGQGGADGHHLVGIVNDPFFQPKTQRVPQAEDIGAVCGDDDRDVEQLFHHPGQHTLRNQPMGMQHIRLFPPDEQQKRTQLGCEEEREEEQVQLVAAQFGDNALSSGQPLKRRKEVAETVDAHAGHVLVDLRPMIMRCMDCDLELVGQATGQFIHKGWVRVVRPARKGRGNDK